MLCLVGKIEDGENEKLAHSALVLGIFIPRGVAYRHTYSHSQSYC